MDAEFGWKTNSNGKHYKVGKGGSVIAGPKAMIGNNVNHEHAKGTSKEPRTKKTPAGSNRGFARTERPVRVGPPSDVTEEYRKNANHTCVYLFEPC